MKKKIPFTIASKIIQLLGINLTKEVKDLYTENYDIDERNGRRHTHTKWKDILCSWLVRSNIVKM